MKPYLVTLLAAILPLAARAQDAPPAPEENPALAITPEVVETIRRNGGAGSWRAVPVSPEDVASPVLYQLAYESRFANQPGPHTHLGVSTSVLSENLAKHLPLPPNTGLTVDAVIPGSPAEKAGLAAGDIIARLDDQILIHPDQFMVLIRNHKEGDQVTLSCIRAGKEQPLTVTLAQRTAESVDQAISSLTGRLRAIQPADRAFIKGFDLKDDDALTIPAPSADNERIDRLSKQVDAMSKRIEDLVRSLDNR